MVNVSTTGAQPPVLAMVLVTVWGPGLLADKSIVPLEAILSPALPVKVPATPPLINWGDGSVALEQYSVDAY